MSVLPTVQSGIATLRFAGFLNPHTHIYTSYLILGLKVIHYFDVRKFTYRKRNNSLSDWRSPPYARTFLIMQQVIQWETQNQTEKNIIKKSMDYHEPNTILNFKFVDSD